MGIKIGNNNRIDNSTIAETINGDSSSNPPQPRNKKKTFYDKHPALCSFLISLIAGIVLLFSFWSDAVRWIEGWF